MPKYLLKVSYSSDGLQKVLASGGSSRVTAVERLLQGVGGTLESFYFAFGSDDVYVIAEVPSHAEAVAIASAVSSSGAVSSYETVVLLSPADIDAARDITVDYAPPGT